MMKNGALASFAAALGLVAVSGEALAEPLHSDALSSHADVWDYALTGLGLTTLGVDLFLSQEPRPRWNGPVLFDEAARDFLRASTSASRDDAAAASWALWFVAVGYPLAVDVPYATARYGRAVAWDLFWQDAAALSLAAAAHAVLADTVGRVRPRNAACLAIGGTDCLRGREATRSFPSGHVTEATTATALGCTQHMLLRLYGGPWDAVACGAAIATDAAIGLLRVMSDNHYATDVLAGAALGALLGWGLPVLTHLHGPGPSSGAAGAPAAGALATLSAPSAPGIGLSGVF